ncbi:MAG TPA: DHA2 family efflux MFS transporter permease subunit [Alphaproteobacteria bacterium]|nr:DHA2 family efflux MFS transporter permease subunit [Alphaproteobacteria bacterium]
MAAASDTMAVNRGMITVSIMLATIMQALDTTIANVALPHMQGSLSASQDQITWVLTSYIVAAAIMTPMTGWLSGRFGRKRVFLISVAGFTIASALCGMAESLTQIVVFRLLQGICGAALVPLSQAVLLDINPPERHGQAMAVWGAGIMVGPILGPTLGGWLTDNYNWRWVFYINLPVGLIAFLGILIFIAESKHDRPRPFDFFGFAALSIGVGALQMMLDRGELKDWFGSTEIWIEAVVSALGWYLFAVHTATAKRPFLNPTLLKDRNFATGTFFIFIVGIILYATLALLPPLLQDLMNYPVVTTGLVTAPRGIGTMIAMILVGRLIGRVDIRLIIGFGFGLTAFSLWQMTGFSLQMDMMPVIVSGITQGFGLGFVFVPLSTVAFATLPPKLRTEGTAIFSLVRNIGSSIGISIVQALLTENTQVVHASLATHVTPFNPLVHPPYLAAGSLGTSAGLAALNAQVTTQAAMIAYIDDFKLMMILALIAMPLLLLLRKGRRSGGRGAASMALD